MPAKKTTTAKTPVSAKTTSKKTTKKVEESVTEVKPEKKSTTKKTTEKKTTTKKTTAKKTTKKVKEVAKEEVIVNKKSVKDYIDIINWKKGEANGMDWLYIEISAEGLLTEVEAGVDNLETVCKAMLDTMLEGDTFIVEAKTENGVDSELRVRYYCDNLSPERRKYSEVN